MIKEKITFTQEQETLLVPLYSKAMESRRSNPIFVDAKAQEIPERVDCDFSTLGVPRQTSIMMSNRGSRIERAVPFVVFDFASPASYRY